ncbi:hypothetical protein MIR68_008253 [Amoeboaphelidium protococcarum]|nr:hypothetical protein MIR68_008253 [Amoeboaphelidium protococcarum]
MSKFLKYLKFEKEMPFDEGELERQVYGVKCIEELSQQQQQLADQPSESDQVTPQKKGFGHRLRRKPKKLSILINSQIYYDVNFNRLFWSQEMKDALTGWKVSHKYSYDGQCLQLKGGSGENVVLARDFVVQRLRTVKAILEGAPDDEMLQEQQKQIQQDEQQPIGLRYSKGVNLIQQKQLKDGMKQQSKSPPIQYLSSATSSSNSTLQTGFKSSSGSISALNQSLLVSDSDAQDNQLSSEASMSSASSVTASTISTESSSSSDWSSSEESSEDDLRPKTTHYVNGTVNDEKSQGDLEAQLKNMMMQSAIFQDQSPLLLNQSPMPTQQVMMQDPQQMVSHPHAHLYAEQQPVYHQQQQVNVASPYIVQPYDAGQMQYPHNQQYILQNPQQPVYHPMYQQAPIQPDSAPLMQQRQRAATFSNDQPMATQQHALMQSNGDVQQLDNVPLLQPQQQLLAPRQKKSNGGSSRKDKRKTLMDMVEHNSGKNQSVIFYNGSMVPATHFNLPNKPYEGSQQDELMLKLDAKSRAHGQAPTLTEERLNTVALSNNERQSKFYSSNVLANMQNKAVTKLKVNAIQLKQERKKQLQERLGGATARSKGKAVPQNLPPINEAYLQQQQQTAVIQQSFQQVARQAKAQKKSQRKQ